MDCKVDYISFNVPTRLPFMPDEPDNQKNAHMVLSDYLGGWWEPIATSNSWEVYKAKGFYHTRIFDTNSKISVFLGSINRHVYVEVGGQALDFIRAIGFYEEFIQRVAARTSRIDFAVDMENEVAVRDFIVNRQKRAFKAGGDIFSEDGDTSYIGSWKGDRFARVYRYHKPHPRYTKLRAEVVLRGDYAKQGIAIVLAEGEVAASMAAHQPFGWSHECWQPSIATTSRIKSNRSDKEAASSIRWLYGDVAACIVRMHREGLINVMDWWDKAIADRFGQDDDIPLAKRSNPKSSGKNDATSR